MRRIMMCLSAVLALAAFAHAFAPDTLGTLGDWLFPSAGCALGLSQPYFNPGGGNRINTFQPLFTMMATTTQGGDVSYAPVLTSSGAGVLVTGPNWNVMRVGDLVTVRGSFTFTPAVAGTAEVVTMPLPTQDGFTRAFTATTQARGICACGDTAAAVLWSIGVQVESKNGASAVTVTIDQATAGAIVYDVIFHYKHNGDN